MLLWQKIYQDHLILDTLSAHSSICLVLSGQLYMFKPFSNYLTDSLGGASFVYPLCYLCFVFVFVMLSFLLTAAL